MNRTALLVALLLVPPPARAADFDPKPVDEVVEQALKAFDAPGAAVVVVKDDEVVYLKGHGVKTQGTDDPVTPDTVFPIASCSKAFTATLVAMLAADGKLKWDDKVCDHRPDFRLADELADREVTLRDLLCHRTGMPRHDFLWTALSSDPDDIIRRWGRAKPSTSFRSTWEYSNVPFTTAGAIAGKLSGSDWATATKQRIFDPLGMTSTSGTAKAGQAAADHATAHYKGFDKTVKPCPWDEVDFIGGAGCVNSSARDMGRWLRFQLAGGKLGDARVMPEAALKETRSPQVVVKPTGPFAIYYPPKAGAFTGYGLGWFVHDYRGHLGVSHGGTLTGFRAQVMMVPDKKVGVCVLCNLRPSLATEAVCKTVLDQLLGLPAEDWVDFHVKAQAGLEAQVTLGRFNRAAVRKKDTKPSLAPAKYAGGYDDPAYGRATVGEADGDLMLFLGKLNFRLEHHHLDTFTAVPVEPKGELFQYDRATFEAHFRLAPDGTVEGMKFLDQEFKRAK